MLLKNKMCKGYCDIKVTKSLVSHALSFKCIKFLNYFYLLKLLND